jgi:hypothetical protein
LDELEREGANPKALNIARLWALTGCRRNEITALKWPEIKLAEGLLLLDDSKTGKSIRPLGAAAIAILESIDRQEGTDFVFPAERGDGHFQGMKRIWSKAIQKASLEGVTPHTLRHTMGSTAVSNGEALALTGAILGHSNPRSTAIYAHVQTDPSRRAANRVARRIADALAGTCPMPSGGKQKSAAEAGRGVIATCFGCLLGASPKPGPRPRTFVRRSVRWSAKGYSTRDLKAANGCKRSETGWTLDQASAELPLNRRERLKARYRHSSQGHTAFCSSVLSR